jgi:tRNA pseudouridine32 synthase / 23S rRNA pseudouridine746 synthase
MASNAPSRAGVSASTVYLPADKRYGTMFEFFTQAFPKIDASIWQERFDQGLVVDQAGMAVSPSAAYVPKQHLFYYRHVESEPRIPFDEVVLYQDEHLVVVDKPHFLPVTPSGRYVQETLLVRLKNKLGLPELSPLHRLDRDTAGLVLFSVQVKERGAYQQMFHGRQVHKTYEAIASYCEDLVLPMTYESRLEDSDIYMQMHEVEGKPNSLTHIALQSILSARPSGVRLASYELKPVTGKRHQLRVHMNALGIPILNDGIYPTLTPEQLVMTEAEYAKPLQLLARRLEFVDPVTKAERIFKSSRTLTHSQN